MVYDSLFTLAFFTRVYLLPVAGVWLLLGVLIAACGRWWMGLACVVIAMCWAAPELTGMRSHSHMPSGPKFSVASFNLNKDLPDAAEAIRGMLAMDADFIVCQEVTAHSAEQLHAALNSRYPHELIFPDAGYNGAAIFSRTPLTLLGAPTSASSRSIRAVATALGQSFTLVDVHLASPQTIGKRRTSRDQVATLIADAAAAEGPMLLIGDFNFSRFTPQGVALTAAGFSEAHRQTGNGRQTTWPTPRTSLLAPRVRIDTAYTYGGRFRAVQTEVGADFGSDHLPIKVTFE